MNKIFLSYLLAALVLVSACRRGGGEKYGTSGVPEDYASWSVYGGSKDNIHYSSLRQIDTSNVGSLRPVWEYHTHDADSSSQIQVNAIVIDSILYGVSPHLRLFALNAASGRVKWVFDPNADPRDKGDTGNKLDRGDKADKRNKIDTTDKLAICRGVAYYNGGPGDRRLFYSAGPILYCIDAATGKPADSFGDQGKIDLHHDLGRDVADLYVAGTTPGIVYKDLLIIGDRVAEEAAAAPGHIRAYDVHTGRLRWIFHTIPQPGEEGYGSWADTSAYRHIGGANSWSGFSLDEKTGIVFAGVGSASFDFYGGRRIGNDLFADCVLALGAATGRQIWHYQTVHHDVWDRDPPAPPVPVMVRKDGKAVDAVAQVTKSGFIFLLDRATGRPLYPVVEQPVPASSELTGERLSSTQPIPTVMPVFARHGLTEADLNRLVPDSSYQDIKKRLAGYRVGMFVPPSREGTVIFPGFDGGAEWGGPAYDPGTGILYVNANEIPWILTMVDAPHPPPAAGSANIGQAARLLYSANCMTCHGPDRQGGGNYPSLIGMKKKYTGNQFLGLITSGRRMMPAFKQLSAAEKQALAAFILDNKAQERKPFINEKKKPEDPWCQLPYTSTGYNKFLTKEGYPAVMPPWGTLTAIDLNKTAIVWRDTLGDYPELKARGIHSGTENYGGPVVTAGGLLFIAATSDAKFRAYNKRTGQLLLEADLPAAGFATPSVYAVGGREYVVIACGGGKLHRRSGDAYIAFALP